jgi:hypothetical protein
MPDEPLHPFRIDEVFVFIVTDGEGEGVPAIRHDDMVLPLFGADVARVESLKAAAARVARQSGKAVKLVRFTQRQELATFDPVIGKWL